jgi:hypothetical protein
LLPTPPRTLRDCLIGSLVALLCAGCSATQGTPSTPTLAQADAAEAAPASTLWPSPLPSPTHAALPSPTPTTSATHTPTPSPAASEAPAPTATPVPTATFSPSDNPQVTDIVAATPDCTQDPLPGSTIDGRRLVAFYGLPLRRGLGILGNNDIPTTIRLLRQQAEQYSRLDPCAEITLVFHTVVTVADAQPGDDGDYNHRVDPETIRIWLDAAAAEGIWVVLDIQPGQGHLPTELGIVESYLQEPNVHLAVDPEFMVGANQVPGRDIGSIDGATINGIQDWLSGIAQRTGTRKILIVHQFDNRMVTNKAAILDYPLVHLVWDADGFGGPYAKISDFVQYSQEPGFQYGGFKLFYNYDVPVMSPAEVLALVPPPAYVVYQ